MPKCHRKDSVIALFVVWGKEIGNVEMNAWCPVHTKPFYWKVTKIHKYPILQKSGTTSKF